MNDTEMLVKVKKSLGVTGPYLNDKIQEDMEEVIGYLVHAGVKRDNITPGLVARGISDLWNQNELSEYFQQRAVQLRYQVSQEEIHEQL